MNGYMNQMVQAYISMFVSFYFLPPNPLVEGVGLAASFFFGFPAIVCWAEYLSLSSFSSLLSFQLVNDKYATPSVMTDKAPIAIVKRVPMTGSSG